MPLVRFVITGNPRCGTSHLASLLDSHPDIGCWDDEIFDAGEAFDSSGCDSPAEFLIRCVFGVNARAVGFKLLWDALDRWDDMWDTLGSLDFAVLHVYRENLLDSFISFQLATLNGAFTSWDGDYAIRAFEADYDQCLEWFELCEDRDSAISAHVATREIPVLDVEYSELCTPDGETRVLDFLQMPRAPLSSRLTKQRIGTQADAIENYRELRGRFSGTRWQHFFT